MRCSMLLALFVLSGFTAAACAEEAIFPPGAALKIEAGWGIAN